jgi:flagellar L-ring protein precursor FlgH
MIESVSRSYVVISALLLAAATAPAADKKRKPGEASALDRYIVEALSHDRKTPGDASLGSLWSPGSRFTDLGTDLRAAHVDDLITIVVNEKASAVATGTTKTARASSLKSSVTGLAGVKSPAGALANLANVNTATSIDGQGTTSRGTSLNTNLSARISHVLPNGYLVVEGTKDVQINSERQIVTVRGVIRPTDLSTGNIVQSDQIAQLEIRVNGKGVVGDAIRRPFILYRLLLGILPF